MWYINESSILDDLEGWFGVDQVGDEEGDPNPNFWPLVNKFEARFGRRVYHAMVGVTYDGFGSGIGRCRCRESAHSRARCARIRSRSQCCPP